MGDSLSYLILSCLYVVTQPKTWNFNSSTFLVTSVSDLHIFLNHALWLMLGIIMFALANQSTDKQCYEK